MRAAGSGFKPWYRKLRGFTLPVYHRCLAPSAVIRPALFPALTAVLLAFGLAAAPALAQQTVTVVTSFPKELTEAYKKAFEAKHPGTRVEILNKNTTAGIAFVRETAAGSRPDVFWASAPDAFEVLAKDGLLTKYDGPTRRCRPKSAPTRSTTRKVFSTARRWPATA